MTKKETKSSTWGVKRIGCFILIVLGVIALMLYLIGSWSMYDFFNKLFNLQ
jgi:hypothetical protein